MVAAIERLLLKAPAVAEALDISERTVFSLGKRGEIPRVMVGRSVRYFRADIEAWIARNKTTTVLVPMPSSV
jgi:excisionase family DNA binding protein